MQRAGFEPAKHYALGPHPSPFDHSGTSAMVLVKISNISFWCEVNKSHNKLFMEFLTNNYIEKINIFTQSRVLWKNWL